MCNNFLIREYCQGDEEYVADTHARVYSEEYNWGPAFSDYAAHVAYDFSEGGTTSGEKMWIAEVDGERAGCIMLCRTDDPAVGQLRLFLVEKAYRRNGIGNALKDTLISEAKTYGYEKLILWTAHPLVDAIHCYEEKGFGKIKTTSNTDWSLSGETVYELEYEMKLQ